MSDLIDVIYRLRNMAAEAALPLRAAIAEAQIVLDRLEAFADDAEYSAQLAASSDRFPTHHATVPFESGLERRRPIPLDEAFGPAAPDHMNGGPL